MRGIARTLRVLVLLGLVAGLLGVGAPLLTGRAAPAAESRAAVPVLLPTTAELPLTEAAARLRPAVPRGYAITAAVPPPTTAASRSTKAAPSPSATSGSAAAPSPRSAPPSHPAAPAGAALPLKVAVGSSTQVVTVVAASSRSTSAKLTAWQLGPNGWTAVLGPVTARIGADGVGAASETTSRTPAGTFTLTEGFGRLGDPGLELPYRVIDRLDWWVSDVDSPLYNQHTRCAPGTCPFDESAGENLWSEGSVYNYAVVIDYNRGGTKGAGSAFFLHVTNGAPTAGCVAIAQSSLVTLMRWLDPAARPLIAIGVG